MSFSPDIFFHRDTIPLIKHFISANNGAEVLIVGNTDDQGLICDVELVAMGHESAVVAVFNAAKAGDILIHNHPSGDIRPSNPDLDLAARAAEKRIGSYIVDNGVTRVFPVVKWLPAEKNDIIPVDDDEVNNILCSDGLFFKSVPDFEFRKPQLEMSLQTARSINNQTLLCAEAGTGTGKSFAYLIPAMLYLRDNPEQKVVVSTSTIALEEQIIEKDIPFLKKHLQLDSVSCALLKGRNNYLCLRKYQLFRSSSKQVSLIETEDVATFIDEIESWIELPHDGSRTTLSNAVKGELWQEINADENSCDRSRCRFFEKCFFYKARRRANFAQILLINHHLLMADVSLRMESDDQNSIIPAYSVLVVDEAHNLFKAAVSFLGQTISTYSIFYNLKRLYNYEKSSGILPRILDHVREKDESSTLEHLVRSLASFLPLYKNSLLVEFFESLPNQKESYFELDNYHVRKKLGDNFERVLEFLSLFSSEITPVIKKIRQMVEEDPLLRTEKDDILNGLTLECSGVIRRIDAIVEFLSSFFRESENRNTVFWGQMRTRSIFSFSMTPLAIQKILCDQLYDKKSSVIFSSATLTTSDNEQGFSFFMREAGLDLSKREIVKLQLESCFDYKKSLRAFCPGDIPSPVNHDFDKKSIAVVKSLIKASNGGALVLFTSIRHRNEAYEQLEHIELPVFSQGTQSATKLVRRFRELEDSSLLATDMFWEGIDVKGKTLRNLIIVRLPFRFPSHPFIKRYVSALEEKHGESGFTLFTLPNAVLKFKQGIGRLIRTKEDRGVVTVLDKRIFEKNYGRNFMRALPEGISFEISTCSLVAKAVVDFFEIR